MQENDYRLNCAQKRQFFMAQAPKNVIETDPPIWVEDAAAFEQMIAHLQTQSVFAIDTESDSLFSYYPKVCLIQISAHSQGSEKVVDYLVDPLAFDALDPLGDLLEDPAYEVIIHSAYNDILTLQRDFEFRFANIFDTQLAARIMGWRQTGLAALLEKHFDVVSNKKMQRTNWGQRPLTKQQIAYAAMDTHYLLELRKIQIEALEACGRWDEAQEGFGFVADVDYSDRPVTERTFWSMKASRDVPREHMGLLEALWEWREKESQRRNRPPFKVMNDHALIALAETKPTSFGQLRQIRGIGEHQSNRYGKVLLRTVREERDRPAPQPPRQKHNYNPLPEHVLDRYDALREWRTSCAKDRGVDPDIVFSNDTLMAIAKAAPQNEADLMAVGEIGPWKAGEYGAKVFEIVARYG